MPPDPQARTPAVTVVLAITTLAILAMLALFVWSSLEMSLAEGLQHFVSTRWGITTLADLGAGVAFVALWIALLETRPWRTACWWIALLCLGNFTTLVFILVRVFKARTLPELVLGSAPSPHQ
jgi:hypothetical protein